MKTKLRTGEKLITSYRQSESALLKPLLVVLLAIYLPWYFALSYDFASRFSTWLLLWTLLVLLYAVRSYRLWSDTQYVITSDRIIVNLRERWFHKAVIEAELDTITAIRYRTTGIAAALFNYGAVELEISGQAEVINLARVRDPAVIRDFLWDLRRNYNKQTLYIQKPEKMI